MLEAWNQLSKDFTSLCASFRALKAQAEQEQRTELATKLGVRLDRLIDEQQAIDAIISSSNPEEWSFETFDKQLRIAKMIQAMSKRELGQ